MAVPVTVVAPRQNQGSSVWADLKGLLCTALLIFYLVEVSTISVVNNF